MDSPNSHSLLRTGLNAHRRPQKPLRPPNYAFQNVPKAERDLKGSTLEKVTNRDHFKECMAEMVLLCTEAIRRTSASRSGAKPLSLEYIADRLDVDDPTFGYLARSKEGMMQGFLTVTTFTNWQKNFRWDSLNQNSFSFDDHADGGKRDVDGSLANELAKTVRLGDPYNEGIVWPRIAEISLLGALGCGKQLVKLAIEQLEFQKPSANANYDYLVLQATDNSIGFYESLGFIRVGAVTYQDEDENNSQQSGRSESPVTTCSDDSTAIAAVPLAPSTPDKADALARPSNIVSSPLTVHEVKKAGESPSDIAKRYKMDVWDIIFLNKDVYPDIAIKSRLKKGTTLYVPKIEESEEQMHETPTKWFTAKENDTPRKIAKMHNVACKTLVQANVNRLPELQSSSRLKEGTRVKVNNFDQTDDICQQYCHWSFPDDSSVDNGEPSYMMVRKIERRHARSPRKVRDSLAVRITPYSTPSRLLEAPKHKLVPATKKLPAKPRAPPQPPTGIDVFMDHQRQLYPELREKTPQNTKIINSKWKDLIKYKKGRYEDVASDCSKHFEAAQEQYEVAMSLWEEACEKIPEKLVPAKEETLFSKVVKLKDDSIEGKNYTYWFVLTYIPDLKWCHLAPMVQDGVFGPERKKSQGRKRWRLVDETLGHELDISAMFCILVKSKALKRTIDADKEEWDILDDGVLPPRAPRSNSSLLKCSDGSMETKSTEKRTAPQKQPSRPRSAVKPMGSGSKIAVKSIKPEPTRQEAAKTVISSPQRVTRSTPVKQSPAGGRRTRSSPPLTRVSPRLTPKRKASDDLDPTRKVRRISNTGTRRSVLQS